jgi:ribosomal protein S27E
LIPYRERLLSGTANFKGNSMLAEEVKCEQCGGVAMKTIERVIYPDGQNVTNSKPLAIVFKITCLDCGTSKVTEPAPRHS